MTLAEGAVRLVRATGVLRLNASASLIVNGSTTQSYTTTAKDLLLFRGYGSSVVNVWTLNTPPYGLAPYPSGHLYGLTLSNNSGTPNSVVDIAAGTCRDSTDAANIDLLSTLSKSIASGWAVGSGNGGLDTGSEATSTWYHVWGIKRPDTGVVDGLFSLSATAPTMPSNYTLKRRLGAVYNDSSGNIKAFVQVGDEFLWVDPPTDVSTSALSTTAVSYTLTVPTGFKMTAIAHVWVAHAVGNTTVYVSSLDQTDTAAGTLFNMDANVSGFAMAVPFARIRLNTSAQLRARASASSTSLTIYTAGYVDTRGRFA